MEKRLPAFTVQLRSFRELVCVQSGSQFVEKVARSFHLLVTNSSSFTHLPETTKTLLELVSSQSRSRFNRKQARRTVSQNTLFE